MEKWQISNALCTLCPDWLVNAALLSNEWLRDELVSSLCSDSPLPTTVSAIHTSSTSWDGPVYSAATFPANDWSQFKLDLKVSETTNVIQRQPAPTAAVGLLPNKSCAAANVSLLARLQKSSTATLKQSVESLRTSVIIINKRLLTHLLFSLLLQIKDESGFVFECLAWIIFWNVENNALQPLRGDEGRGSL